MGLAGIGMGNGKAGFGIAGFALRWRRQACGMIGDGGSVGSNGAVGDGGVDGANGGLRNRRFPAGVGDGGNGDAVGSGYRGDL